MTAHVLLGLPPEGRKRLMECAREAFFEPGTRIFDEGTPAERFWIIRSGSVTLDVRLHGEPSAVETLGHGDLLGWSWLVPPYAWTLGAEAFTPVRADEFDASTVRTLCSADPALGLAIAQGVLGIAAERLQATRRRLMDLPVAHAARGMPALA